MGRRKTQIVEAHDRLNDAGIRRVPRFRDNDSFCQRSGVCRKREGPPVEVLMGRDEACNMVYRARIDMCIDRSLK